ncbi:MAG: ROK family protein [Actinobacteria bacterium]|uniref:Unannotated protein n=1 Tax=freshwater metagenome TaxID=449393 RepID=A0A6J7VWC7_9ZZZZ|nr:ROK family protein [Actinomycetota bacterium]MSX71430.1 ROK family protein [Actinomycetota bacterium]MSY69318.1 ROK family protein [Actinomycetota bacterium]MTA75321.1 ROK family protein [Actinomycetota bacterium]
MTKYLGLDLGGTNIKICVLGLQDGELTLIERGSVPTEAIKGPAHVVNLLAQIAHEYVFEKYSDIGSVGVAVPGIFDHDLGEIILFPNLPGDWLGQPMQKSIEEKCQRPVSIINDARAFSLAEANAGIARGKSPVACLVLGTGFGGGIIFDGKVHMGSTLGAGEIGHQIVQADGEICGCGAQGCIETLTSAEALSKRAGTQTPEEAYKRAIAGDPKAIAAFEESAKWVGIGIANLMVVLAPELFIIGGGLSESGEFFLELIRREAAKRAKLVPDGSIKIVAASLGVYAGSIGAALNGAMKAGAQFNLISIT